MFDITGIGSVVDVIGSIINKIFPDKNVSEQAKVRLSELAHEGQLKELELLLEQIKVNAVEAASDKWWKAGARPFILWVCGGAFAYHYIVQPMLGFFTGWPMPTLDMGELMTVLLGILGLGAYRSYDKKQLSNNKGDQ
jgi:hypothetical protein